MKTFPLLQPLTSRRVLVFKAQNNASLSRFFRRIVAGMAELSPALVGASILARRSPYLRHSEQTACRLQQAVDKSKPELQQVGSVALVGAGPGSKDLITLRGAQRLQEADVIFYDRLVDPEILDLARANAERIYVGKAPGCHHWPQEKISMALVTIAGKGQRVVRLKCGDPGVFARGAEEIDALDAADIPYEIIPGVTAASAASAALGGFLTERGTCDTLVLATGQTAKDEGNANWIAQLQPGTRIAIYMGVGAAANTAKALIGAGLEKQVSIDIVSRAQQSDQVIAKCRASTLLDTIETSGISNPAIMFLTWPQSAT
jgi:uroporphyrin-III C-methyltransferase/precorrin-2 dehydrogenase/sirohydrochlorin ferrochelatase